MTKDNNFRPGLPVQRNLFPFPTEIRFICSMPCVKKAKSPRILYCCYTIKNNIIKNIGLPYRFEIPAARVSNQSDK
jgi:hypothetical protein